MKLYYSAGSCSTSCHITLEESGLKYEALPVDWDNPSDPNAKEAARLNPLGTLPILITDQGRQLDQNIGIHTYVADRAPERNLLPSGGFERAEAMNWLSFVGADLHKAYGNLFALESITQLKPAQADIREFALENLRKLFSYLDQRLAGRDYILGKNFSAVDSYCFVVTGWTKFLNIPLDPFKNVQAYQTRVYQRPAVQKVFKQEGLLD